MPITPESSFPDLRLSTVTTHRGQHLPRWTANGAVYHVAFHLADSVPQTELAAWRELRNDLRLRALVEKRPLSDEEVEQLKACYDARVERYLAAGCGACLLRRPDAAAAVAEALEHDNASQYALHVYTVMPNHLHVVVGGFAAGGKSLGDAIKAWKSVTAHRLNQLLCRKGAVWMKDSYTHIIRNEAEYRSQLSYVWNNPVVAGLTNGYLRKRFVEW